MCGLVGFIDNKKRFDVLEDMLEIQSHRGPDDRGLYFDEESGVHLGHNRLSILDLTKSGHQPMVSRCGKYVITYNGEVYNFKDIRKQLEGLGYKFKSNTDTEVILYAYKEWGIKAVEKFIGMFAIAILDKKRNKLILIRDRAGVKPLYYYFDGKTFMFSSEIKSFHKNPSFKKDIQYDVLPYFFQFGYIPEDFSIFKNVKKLEAGSYLEFDIVKHKIKKEKYWDLESFFLEEKISKKEEEILEEIEEILTDSIKLRLVSDVPLGVFLSGGYDSSFVASILTKKLGENIKTFSIGFKEKEFNEASYAKNIAEYLGTEHTEFYMDEDDMLNLIEKLPFYYDEPFGDSSALPTMLLSKITRQHVKVALSGDGGDEIFIGYSKYIFLDRFINYRKNSLFKIFVNAINENILESINNLLSEKIKQRNIKERFVKFKRAVNSKSLEEMFYNASRYNDFNILRDQEFSLPENFKNKNHLDFIDYMSLIDYKNFLKDDVLVKVDRATMAFSLEGREPLLDHRIIEYMARIPVNTKYKDRQNKYILRKILYKYVPKELIDRPKSGFQVPLSKWMRGKIRSLLEDAISQLDAYIFDIEKVEKAKEKFLKGEDKYTNLMWFLLVYKMWENKWIR